MSTKIKNYNSHLFTFCGREYNLRILLVYIELALKINALDHYWFVDMTRNRKDHKFVLKSFKRLSKIYPNRVHLFNHEERAKILKDPNLLKKESNNWSVFYSFLSNFKDNDVIAKCDDDILFLDVETLKSAFDLRWNNKKPFLMHSNCINNGVCAYHQRKLNIWLDEETKTYPHKGLNGPLFSNPQIALDHHNKFCEDLLDDYNNLESYKLQKNILFCNRISINFIFVLGKDRNLLSNIGRQDEYEISSRYPQLTDRPNLIIGDFITSHHTYGPQKDLIVNSRNIEKYYELSKKKSGKKIFFKNKPISNSVNKSSSITYEGKSITKNWIFENSFVIQNLGTQNFISSDFHNSESRKLISSKNIKDAIIFNLDYGSYTNLHFSNSSFILNHPEEEEFSSSVFPINYFYQNSYKKFILNFEMKNDGEYIIYPHNNSFSFLTETNNFKKYSFEQSLHPQKWKLIKLKSFSEEIFVSKIHRWNSDPEVDFTWMECLSHKSIPNYSIPRDFYWNISGHIWEFETSGNKNEFFIKPILDDSKDLYLFCVDFYNVKLSKEKDKWKVYNNTIQNIKTRKYLSIKNNNINLESKPFKLDFEI